MGFSLSKVLKKVASVALPIVGNIIAPGIGGVIGGALGGAVSGGGVSGALTGALGGLGGTGGILGNAAGGALGGTGGSLLGILGGSLMGGSNPISSLLGGGGLSSLLSSTGLSGNQNAGYSPGEITSGAIGSTGGTSNQGLSSLLGQAGATSYNTNSPLSTFTSQLEKNPIQGLGALLSIAQSMNPTTPKGTTTQQDVQDQIAEQKANDEKLNQNIISSLSSPGLNRQQTAPQIDYYHYGSRPEAQFFDNVKPQPGVVGMKRGGAVKSLLRSGQADNVPANLSEGEFVIPADVVAHLGDGNTNGGAKQLSSMIKGVRKAKGAKPGLPKKAKSPLSYAGAA